jgi:glucose/arabinose dehydrogenase
VWPGDPSSLYVASREGKVFRIRGEVTGPLLNISAATTTDGERGLLGMTFTAARIFVSYTNTNGDNQLDSYPMNGDGSINTSGRTPLMTVAHPMYSNHNGGNVVVGPDGYLYWGLGDGGGGGDPFGNAQSLGTYRGKLVQVHPDTGAAAIVDWGLRNPWRFSFDLATGDLYLADVGQDLYEEVDWRPWGAVAGANFGWNAREGLHPYNGGGRPAGNVDPIWEYSHNDGQNRCAITGGYVYRGSRIPALAGAYVFSDFCGGEVHALVNSGGTVVAERGLGINGAGVASFAQDAAGELYVLSFNGTVYRIDPA